MEHSPEVVARVWDGFDIAALTVLLLLIGCVLVAGGNCG